ncbi:MAG: hypothetical protein R3D03_12895 [Geminicoccaceae bacterium]
MLVLDGNAHAASLIEAIEHFKVKDGAVGRGAPLDFLEPAERKAITGEDGGSFRTSLYKAFLFLRLTDAIKAGNVNLMGSYKYRPLDDYLIKRRRWNKKKSSCWNEPA